MSATDPKTLQDVLENAGDLVSHFYNDTAAPHGNYRAALSPVPVEFTNWREEQRSWREAAVLFDQSHHMPELFLRGPDARALLNKVGVNRLDNLVPGKAKQFVGCNRHGQVIGESILYCHGDDDFELVSGMHLHNWIAYNAEIGGYDVEIERDPPTGQGTGDRVKFRFGLDGPQAEAIFQEIVEGEAPAIKFFNTAKVRIAGCDVMALRHGMAGHKGVELSGAFPDGQKVLDAVLAAGAKHGIKRGGTSAYYSTCVESGWLPYPLPAIYTDPELKAYREWLPATSWEAYSQLGGSYIAERLEDYYLTPYDMGYRKLVSFDHDFIGRDALVALADKKGRTKVTLEWDEASVRKLFDSYTTEGLAAKYVNMPMAAYAFQHNDEVRDTAGNRIGVSTFCGYSINEKRFLSIAVIDDDLAEPGTHVVLVWGEPDGGSRKPHVERHAQMELQATVAPVPYARTASELKNAGLGLRRAG